MNPFITRSRLAHERIRALLWQVSVALKLDERQERPEFASAGEPMTGARVRFRTDDKKFTRKYEVVNLELSGPVLFDGYHNDPTSTAKAFTGNGWFVTGDRACKDTTRNLSLAGRAKEVIVINRVIYFPQEIEIALERAAIPGNMPSYIAAFPFGDKGTRRRAITSCMAPFKAKMPRDVWFRP